MSVCTWRWARWPYNVKVAGGLDSFQSHVFQLLFPLVNTPNEQPDAYFLMVRLQSGRRCAKAGRFSSYWAGAIKRWDKHLHAASVDTSWSSQISQLFQYHELEAARTSKSRGSKRDRTGTRACAGHVHMRWSEGLEVAKGVPSGNPSLPSKARIFDG